MRKYRSSADSPLRVDYGVELCEGLRLFPETTALADDFEVQNDELQAAYDTRRAARKALVKARAQLRFANYLTDQEIRSASKALDGLTDPQIYDPLVVTSSAGKRGREVRRDEG